MNDAQEDALIMHRIRLVVLGLVGVAVGLVIAVSIIT